jgi:hypothetical protein
VTDPRIITRDEARAMYHAWTTTGGEGGRIAAALHTVDHLHGEVKRLTGERDALARRWDRQAERWVVLTPDQAEALLREPFVIIRGADRRMAIATNSIDLFEQFYTEERYYRIRGSNGKMITGTIVNEDMYSQWDRTAKNNAGDVEVDEMGNPIVRSERFVPEMDVRVQILSEKPTDRNYYTSVGFEMFGRGLMTGEDLWYTIEEGKFPPKDDVLKNVQSQNLAMQITNILQQLPQEMQQQAAGIVQESLNQVMMNVQQNEMVQKQMQKMMEKSGAFGNVGGNFVGGN